MRCHAVWRALLLVGLGIFLRSDRPAADELHLRGHAVADRPGLRVPVPARVPAAGAGSAGSPLAVILVGYWAAVRRLYPAAGVGLRLRRRRRQAGLARTHNYAGFAAHWNKNTNLGLRRSTAGSSTCSRARSRSSRNAGGYATLSFIPTLATMILGLIAGTWHEGRAAAARRVAAAVPGRGGLPGRRPGLRGGGHLPDRQARSGRRRGRSTAAARASCSCSGSRCCSTTGRRCGAWPSRWW